MCSWDAEACASMEGRRRLRKGRRRSPSNGRKFENKVWIFRGVGLYASRVRASAYRGGASMRGRTPSSFLQK